MILIVEDDMEIAALEKDYLTIAGYETEIAADGFTGLERAVAEDVELVVLDIMLPGLDGFTVLKKLRERSVVPVIVLSARGEDIDKIRGLGLGADDYMLKPFSPNELVARVRAHLARYERLTGGKAQKKPACIEVRGLHIDKDGRRVSLHGEEKALTPKEYDILLFLAENPNRVYGKEDLFEKVWGMEAMGESSTVVVHMRKLREKIEPDPQNPQYIETVWGVGYRFRA